MPKLIKPYFINPNFDPKQMNTVLRQTDEMFGIIFDYLNKDTSATTKNIRHICVPSFSTAETVMIMDGTASFVVPEEMDGYVLTDVLSTVYVTATADTDIQLRLSRINEAETARDDTDLLMDGVNPDYLEILVDELYGTKKLRKIVKKGDIIFVDVDDTSGDALGLFTTLTFEE
jgi:ACT domain-containing protein